MKAIYLQSILVLSTIQFLPGAYADASANCPEDILIDGRIDAGDLNQILGMFGNVCIECAEDLNGDAYIDIEDLNLLLSSWGEPCDDANLKSLSAVSQSTVPNKATTAGGMSEAEMDHVCAVFPNPNDGRFTIDLSGTEGSIKLEVYNAAGQILLNKSFEGSNHRYREEVDLGGDASGLYNIRLKSGSKVTTHRVIVR